MQSQSSKDSLQGRFPSQFSPAPINSPTLQHNTRKEAVESAGRRYQDLHSQALAPALNEHFVLAHPPNTEKPGVIPLQPTIQEVMIQ